MRHFLGRGFVGKAAMVVSIVKATALRMHGKVRKYWATETERVQKELGELHYQPGGGGMTPEQARRDLRMAELKQRLISNDYMWLQHNCKARDVEDTPIYAFFSDGDGGTSLFHPLYTIWLKRWELDGNEPCDLDK